MIPTEEQLQQFSVEGFFVTEPFLNDGLLDEIARDFDVAREARDRELREGNAGITHRDQRYFIAHMHEVSNACTRLVTSGQVVELAAKLVGPDVRLYWNQAVIKPPRKGASFAWHQDTGYVVVEPKEYLTCWIPIDDSTIENGCIWVIPGSHKWGLLEHVVDENMGDKVGYRGEEVGIPVPVRRGQVVAFSSLLLHRSGPNTTDGPRRAYVVQYCSTQTVKVDTGERWGDTLELVRGGALLF